MSAHPTSQMQAETLAIAELAAAALHRQHDAITAVAARIRAFAPRGLATVARGTSDHAAEFAIRLVGAEIGLIGARVAPSLVTLARAPLRFEGQLVLAVSQSGRSPDVVEPVAAARVGGALTVAVTNDRTSPLAAAAECVVDVDAGPELSVAATKSYVLSLLQLARLTAAWGGSTELEAALEGLPPLLEAAAGWPSSDALAPGVQEAFEGAGPRLVVGRGLAFATARELALKMKETCGLHAEAVSGAEVMHGPKALIGPGTPVVLLAGPDLPIEAQAATAAELARLGAMPLVVGSVDLGTRPWLATARARASALQPLIDIVPCYLLVEQLSRRRGLAPDRPRHLAKITETR